MASSTEQQQRRRPPAWGLAVAALSALESILLLLLPASHPIRRGPPPAELLKLTIVAGATEKGAVCLDGTPPGYNLQRGSGDGSNSWVIHLQGQHHQFLTHCLFLSK